MPAPLRSGKLQRLLLIVDPQRAFWSPAREAIYDRIRQLLEYYERALTTQVLNDEASPFRTLLHWNECLPGTNAAAIDERFAALPSVQKRGYGIEPSKIRSLIRGLDGIDICGFDTDACVLTSSLYCFDAGVDVRIVHDCCDGPLHDEALRILKRQLGESRVVDSHEVVRDVRR